MQIYNCFCCIFVSLIIVGATEFIAAVHLLYNVLSFYTCQTGQFFEFNEIIYYIWRQGWDGANFRADSRVLPGERNHRGLFGACGALLPGEWSRGRAPSGSVPEQTQRNLFPDVTLQHSRIKLRTYTGEPMPVLGEMTVDVTYRQNHYTLALFVVEGIWSKPVWKKLAAAYLPGLEVTGSCDCTESALSD